MSLILSLQLAEEAVKIADKDWLNHR